MRFSKSAHTKEHSPHSACHDRIRILTLLLSITLLAFLWHTGYAWRWYNQTFLFLAALAAGLVALRLVQSAGGLPTLFPRPLHSLLVSPPRGLFSRPSLGMLALSLLLAVMYAHFSDSTADSRYKLTIQTAASHEPRLYQVDLQRSSLHPYDTSLLSTSEPASLHFQGYTHFPQTADYKPILFTTTGQTKLILDGKSVAEISPDPANRVAIPTLPLTAGWHRVEILHTTPGVAPYIDLRWQIETDTAFSPISLQTVPQIRHSINTWRNVFARLFAGFSLFLSIILLASVLVSAVPHYIPRLDRSLPSLLPVLLIIFCVFAALLGRLYVLKTTAPMFESDEAAFGLMAQRFLHGELPPIFHYGQPYQGTPEVIYLAALLKTVADPSFALKLAPLLLYLVFAAITLFLYARIARPFETWTLAAVLIFSPFLLLWISLKTWFGYSETLFSSAIILFSTYKLVVPPSKGDRYWIFVLGLVSGLSLYILPFTGPVILSALIILFWCRSNDRTRVLLPTVLILAAVALPPYWIHDFTQTAQSPESLSFLAKGRELGAPRVAGERPFFDRFLNECFPVLVGGRTTYDDQHDISVAGLARVLYLITLCGVVFLCFDVREDFRRFIRRRQPGRFLFLLPAVLAIPVGVYSPFGIWPWYFLPIYFGLPLVWAAFFRYTFHFARPLAVTGAAVCVVVWVSAATHRPELMFQPGSLVKTGVLLREDNTPVIDTLLAHGVHHVICDQGADFAPGTNGRDWIGERLTFESGLRINAIHPLTRRHPHLFAETKSADRVAYLFNRAYLFWDVTAADRPGYQPVTIDSLSRLFGPDYLGYERIPLDNDVLFIPPPDHPSNSKGNWRVTGNRGGFFGRLHDHSISARADGPTYWSSGEAQTPGDFIQIDIGKIIPMRGVVMYHGTKTLDRPHAAKVLVSGDNEQWWEMGRLSYDPAARVTFWRHTELFHARYIRIELTHPADPPESWWTVYQFWLV